MSPIPTTRTGLLVEKYTGSAAGPEALIYPRTTFCTGAIFGSIMLTSAMTIKAPHPSYKLPGLDAGPVADGASKAAPVAPPVQVNRIESVDRL